jgi:hypothetical protein
MHDPEAEATINKPGAGDFPIKIMTHEEILHYKKDHHQKMNYQTQFVQVMFQKTQ